MKFTVTAHGAGTKRSADKAACKGTKKKATEKTLHASARSSAKSAKLVEKDACRSEAANLTALVPHADAQCDTLDADWLPQNQGNMNCNRHASARNNDADVSHFDQLSGGMERSKPLSGPERKRTAPEFKKEKKKRQRHNQPRKMLHEIRADGTARTLDIFDSDDSYQEIEHVLQLRAIRKACPPTTTESSQTFLLLSGAACS